MHRTPGGPQRSPGWTFPGARSPRFSPGSPRWSAGSGRGHADGSPAHFGGRGFGDPVRRGGGFRRPQSFSPSGAPNLQSGSSNVPVEKFFSPSMVQDPWRTLEPVTAEDVAARRGR